MTEDLDLKPLAQAIAAMLPPGRTFVILVLEDTEGPARTQYISPMEPRRAFKAVESFVNQTRDNPVFNQR